MRIRLSLCFLILASAPTASADEKPAEIQNQILRKEIAELKEQLHQTQAQLKKVRLEVDTARQEAKQLREVADQARSEAINVRDRAQAALAEAEKQRAIAELEKAEANKQSQRAREAEEIARKQTEETKRAAEAAFDKARAIAEAVETKKRDRKTQGRRRERGNKGAARFNALKEQLNDLQAEVREIREILTAERTKR